MSYMWGITTERPTRAEARRRREAAKAEGATYVEVNVKAGECPGINGGRYQGWYVGPNSRGRSSTFPLTFPRLPRTERLSMLAWLNGWTRGLASRGTTRERIKPMSDCAACGGVARREYLETGSYLVCEFCGERCEDCTCAEDD